jgi:predicted nucleic acid-binding protein
MTPDVNVLVAASRADHPHHGVARAWLEAAVGSSETGAALTGLSAKPATAIDATATDEARMQELVLRRSLLMAEFLNIRVLSKDLRTNM